MRRIVDFDSERLGDENVLIAEALDEAVAVLVVRPPSPLRSESADRERMSASDSCWLRISCRYAGAAPKSGF